MVPLVIMENPMGRPRFVIRLKSNRPIGDVGPRIPPIQRWLCSEIFWQTKVIDRFELTMRSTLSIYVFRQCLENVFMYGTNPLAD